MHIIVSTLFCVFVVCVQLSAASPMARCYIGEEDRFIANPEWFELGPSIDGKIPKIIYSGDGNKPAKIQWVPLEKGVTVEITKIGDFQGCGIHRLTYRAKENPGGITGPLCTLFACESNEPGNRSVSRVRPFFVLVGDDQLASAEDYFTSSKAHPFSLFIQQNLKGNGVYWSSYCFTFTAREVQLTERAGGGRHVRQKIYFYNRRGKVTSVSVEPAE